MTDQEAVESINLGRYHHFKEPGVRTAMAFAWATGGGQDDYG